MGYKLPVSSITVAVFYSETLNQVQWGKNKEDDKLPQINLLLVFGEKSGLPFYYRKLAGNIPDSKTVKHLLEDLDILGFGKTKFVMDRGFYSENNINGLYREHVKFLVGVKLSLKFIKKHLDKVYDDIRMFTTTTRASTLTDIQSRQNGITLRRDRIRAMLSRINEGSISITTTASKKVLMTSRLLINGSPSCVPNFRKVNSSRNTKKLMHSSLK